MIDKIFITKVKTALNIVNIVESFIPLYKTGVNYKGVCPFHDDHTPSMIISPTRQTYHCFVCGSGGDVISFIEHHLGLTFIEALRWCAAKANIEFPKSEMTPEEEHRYRLREAQRIAVTVAEKMSNRADQGEYMLASDNTLRLLSEVHAWMLADADRGNIDWLSRDALLRAEIVPFVATELSSFGWTLMTDCTAPDPLGTHAMSKSFARRL